MDDVKDIIKRRRESLGLTLEDVAAKVNVNASTVMRWETGRIENMKRDKITSLAEVLKISPAVIMGWEEPREKETVKMNEFIKEINDLTADANEHTKQAILDYVHYTVDRQKKDNEGGVARVTKKDGTI
jgi:repressor LexA